jgi:histidine triad (HIT) family protein
MQSLADSACTFCRVIAGALPSAEVHRDGVCVAFLDIHPINPGHTLVVPRKHAAELSALDADVAGHLMIVPRRVALALRRSPLRCEGVNLLLSDGESAGQDVPHVHLHVVPRYVHDGFTFERSRPSGLASRDDLAAVAVRIKDSLGRLTNG